MSLAQHLFKSDQPVFTKTTFLFWLGMVLLPLIWFWPHFTNASFWMRDDAHDIHIFQAMSADLGGWIASQSTMGEGGGRLRPVFWLIRFFLYYVPFGANPLSWYIVQYLVLIFILSCAFILVILLTGSAPMAFMAGAIWVLNAKTLDNFQRFANAEVWQFFWLVMLFLAGYRLFRTREMIKKAVIAAVISLLTLLFYFSKETSVILLPFAAVCWLASLIIRKNRSEWTFFLVLNGLLFLMQRAASPEMVGYSSNFQVNIPTLADNLNRYFFRMQGNFFICALIVSFLVRTLNAWKRDPAEFRARTIEHWQFGLLVLGGGFFMILLPWKLPAPRYLVCAEFLFAIFTALELWILYQWLSERLKGLVARKLCLAALVGGILCGAALSPGDFIPTVRYVYAKYETKQPFHVLQWFGRRADRNAKVLFLLLEEEMLLSTAIYLQDWAGRDDLTIYTFSAHAQKYGNAYNIKQVMQADWPRILDEMDYIFWIRRGPRKTKLDTLKQQIIRPVLNSPYRTRMVSIYEELGTKFNPSFPFGVQIWKLNHDKMRVVRQVLARQQEEIVDESRATTL